MNTHSIGSSYLFGILHFLLTAILTLTALFVSAVIGLDFIITMYDSQLTFLIFIIIFTSVLSSVFLKSHIQKVSSLQRLIFAASVPVVFVFIFDLLIRFYETFSLLTATLSFLPALVYILSLSSMVYYLRKA
jgi:hypothetical protein